MKIIVEQWGNHEFYFDPQKVKEAETNAEVIECLVDHRGIHPYSPVRCALLAESPEGKKLADEIRRLCEGKGDKGKVRKGIRKATII